MIKIDNSVHRQRQHIHVTISPWHNIWVGGRVRLSFYLGKQWAAVSTHSLLIREPPQKWLLELCRLACHGQLPATASWPPTIFVLREAMPHTGEDTEERQLMIEHTNPSQYKKSNKKQSWFEVLQLCVITYHPTVHGHLGEGKWIGVKDFFSYQVILLKLTC